MSKEVRAQRDDRSPIMGEEEADAAVALVTLTQDPEQISEHKHEDMSFILLLRAILSGICFGLSGLCITLWIIRAIAYLIGK